MNSPFKAPEFLEANIKAVFGRWRRFGMDGPIYEILEERARSSPRGPVVRVRVVESGEELDYRLESLIGDPQER